MKKKIMRFFCPRCSRTFNTSTFFGRDQFKTWCPFCGSTAEEYKKESKQHCRYCRKKIIAKRSDASFCSAICKSRYYGGVKI